MKTKGIAFLPLLLMLFAAQGCDGNRLKDLASALQIIAESNLLIQTAVIEAEENWIIDTEDARPIIDITERIGLAGVQATRITRTMAELDEGSRSNLFEILEPIMEIVEAVLDEEGLSGIHDEALRLRIGLLFVGINAALETTRMILEDS